MKTTQKHKSHRWYVKVLMALMITALLGTSLAAFSTSGTVSAAPPKLPAGKKCPNGYKPGGKAQGFPAGSCIKLYQVGPGKKAEDYKCYPGYKNKPTKVGIEGAPSGGGVCIGQPISTNPQGGGNFAGASGGAKGTADNKKDNDAPTLHCTELSFNPLNWVLCPLVNSGIAATGQINHGINALLTVNTNGTGKHCGIFSNCGAGPAFHNAWSEFRTIALSLIVIAALVMVVAQAVGTEVIDAYTIRKVLPRLLVAAIFITLSWILMNFLINLTNDVGNSLRSLIYAPFEDFIKGGDNTIDIGGSGGTVAALLGGGALFTFGLLGTGAFVLTALLAAFMAFMLMILRQLVIMLLIVVAPVAIACYVLPNTTKGFTLWKDTLFSMLLVFPIISALIAMGRVGAILFAGGSNSGIIPGLNNTFGHIAAIVAYFVPYALIPVAFRYAGGAMATITGGIQNAHSGAFNHLKQFRGNERKRVQTNRAAGHMINEHKLDEGEKGSRTTKQKFGLAANRLQSRLNSSSQVATTPRQWLKGTPKDWRGNVQAMQSNTDFDESMRINKEDKNLEAHRNDDKWLQAMSAAYESNGSRSVEDAMRAEGGFQKQLDDIDNNTTLSDAEKKKQKASVNQALNQAVARGNQFKGDNGERAGQIAIATARGAETAGYDYKKKDKKGNFLDEAGNIVDENEAAMVGADQAAMTAARASGGNKELNARVAATIKQNAERAGRTDIGGGSTGTFVGESLKVADAVNQYGADSAQAQQAQQEFGHSIRTNIAKSMNNMNMLQSSKPQSLEAILAEADHRVRQLSSAESPESVGAKDVDSMHREMGQLIGTMKNIQDEAPRFGSAMNRGSVDARIEPYQEFFQKLQSDVAATSSKQADPNAQPRLHFNSETVAGYRAQTGHMSGFDPRQQGPDTGGGHEAPEE
jgi:hypothetical protein